MRRLLARIALALAVLLAAPAPLGPAGVPGASAAAPTGAITWTVDHKARTINVLVRLEIYTACSGDPVGSGKQRASACVLPRSAIGGPTQFMADKIKRQIERVWNPSKPYRYRCYTMEFRVDIKLGTDRAHVASDRIGVRIDPSPLGIREYVDATGASDARWQSNDPADRLTPQNDGRWETTWSEHAAFTLENVYAHEFGHILGLHDTYRDVVDPATGEVRSEGLPGAPKDLMGVNPFVISQETINRVAKRNMPDMRTVDGKPVTDRDFLCDYRGQWGGRNVAGSLRYCGEAKEPYWGMDVVSNSGDRAYVAYLIPEGSETPVEGELVVPFVVPAFDKYVRGTGAFVKGDPPHFFLDIGEGSFIVTLEVGTFCPRPDE